jgi:hypothetical protein
VAEETHANNTLTVGSASARAAYNLQIEGSRFDPAAGRDILDRIILVDIQ